MSDLRGAIAKNAARIAAKQLDAPATKDDQYYLRRATPEHQGVIRSRVAELGGDRDAWKFAMAEHRRANVRHAPQRVYDRLASDGIHAAKCHDECGWTFDTLSASGLSHAVHSHIRASIKERVADDALIAGAKASDA